MNDVDSNDWWWSALWKTFVSSASGLSVNSVAVNHAGESLKIKLFDCEDVPVFLSFGKIYEILPVFAPVFVYIFVSYWWTLCFRGFVEALLISLSLSFLDGLGPCALVVLSRPRWQLAPPEPLVAGDHGRRQDHLVFRFFSFDVLLKYYEVWSMKYEVIISIMSIVAAGHGRRQDHLVWRP